MLSFFEAVVLGIVQGTAEWLPISSEGMTSLVMINFFGKTLSEAIPISIWLHLGTLLAATVYFKKDVFEILSGLPGYFQTFSSGGQRDPIISFLIISTMLTGIVGLPLVLLATDHSEISGASATALIGVMLIVTGVLQRTASRGVTKKVSLVIRILSSRVSCRDLQQYRVLVVPVSQCLLSSCASSIRKMP